MLYKKTNCYELYQGKMEEELSVLKDNSVDSIITDPPYELNFMNKGWDNAGVSFQKETWEKCLRVLKPGGHLLAFGGSRTFHRIACAIEDAGFEIRDTIMWIYGSGFPKSMNIGLAIDKKNGVESKVVGYEKTTMQDFRDVGKKQKEISGIDKLTFGQIENSERKQQPIYEAQNEWKGWGTSLKPSFEPIIIARKPFKGSLVDNVMEYGVGGINIDECRVFMSQDDIDIINAKSSKNPTDNYNRNDAKKYNDYNLNIATKANEKGRFPANTILTYDDTDYEEVCGGFPDTKSEVRKPTGGIILNPKDGWNNNSMIDKTERGFNDEGSASRYFYCAKASKKDRDEGLDKFGSEKVPHKNIHPTVKPTDLMQYLVRLVSPKGATVLDPFMGSGSTGKAVMFENRERNANYKFIGIEMTEDYLPICEARINYAMNYVYGDDDYDISKQPTEITQNKKELW